MNKINKRIHKVNFFLMPSGYDITFIDIEIIAPIRQRFQSSIKFKKDSVSRVVCLLHWCSPAAIFRKIPLVIIDAINGMLLAWFLTHVIKEIFKRFKPTVTNFYASCAISVKTFAIWVATSFLYVRPRFVFCRFTHLMSQTTTRFSVIIFNSNSSNCNIISTFTDAIKTNHFIATRSELMRGYACYRQSVEFLTSKIDELTHNILHLNINHNIRVWLSDMVSDVRVAFPSQKVL